MPSILTIKAKILSESLVILHHFTPCYIPDDNNYYSHICGRIFVDKVTLLVYIQKLCCVKRSAALINVVSALAIVQWSVSSHVHFTLRYTLPSTPGVPQRLSGCF